MRYINTKQVRIIRNESDVVKINKQNVLDAAASLTESAFKMYIYFLLCGKDYIKFEAKVIAEDVGINPNSVRNGYNLLRELGYIVEIDDDNVQIRL